MFIQAEPKLKNGEEKAIRYILNRFSKLKENKERWNSRRKKFLDTYDNFLNPKSYLGYESVAKVRVQVTEWMRQTVHSYLLHACFGVDPLFTVKPVDDYDKTKVEDIDKLMSWTLDKYMNYGNGGRDAVEDWLTDMVDVGFGFAKLRWDIIKRKSKRLNLDKDLERLRNKANEEDVNLEDLVEEDLFTYFDGPVLEPLDPEDVFFPGRSAFPTDPNKYSIFIHRIRKNPSWVRKQIKEKNFRKKEAEEILEKTESEWEAESSGEIKRQRDRNSGVEDNKIQEDKQYTFLEVYFDYQSDDGEEQKLVAVIHPNSKTMVSLTYVDLVNPTGNIPIYKLDFHKRRGRTHSRGLPETLYQTQKETDIMHNIGLDLGIMNTMPFGLYKPAPGAPTDVIKLKPGVLLPASDPQSDMNFPYRAQTQNWSSQQEQVSIGYAAKSAFVNDLMMGQMPSPVGGARSTSGMRQLLAQIGVNMDKILKRTTKTYSKMLTDLFAMLQVRMPTGTKVRLGIKEIEPGITRDQLGGIYDFKMNANSLNVNREMDVENAMFQANLLLSRIPLELGLVNRKDAYNILTNVMKKRGEVATDLYITPPENVDTPLSVTGELDAIMQGEMPRIVINDKHKEKIEAIEEFTNSEEFSAAVSQGKVNESWQIIKRQLIAGHNRMLEMLERAEQMSNYQGSQAPMQEKGGTYGGIGQETTPGTGSETGSD